jgi:hypothetical protein
MTGSKLRFSGNKLPKTIVPIAVTINTGDSYMTWSSVVLLNQIAAVATATVEREIH